MEFSSERFCLLHAKPSTDYPCTNLEPDQTRHEVESDLDSNCMTL